jgi:large subunit ribosomal protein L15e
MAHGMYHYLKQAWKKPTLEMRKQQIAWRRGNAIEIVEKPLRLDRARALGYKAKPGFVVVRVKLLRGGRRRAAVTAGRRTKRMSNKLVLKLNYQAVAEMRAARRYKNLEVLNSYWIGQDGRNYFYEVILIDPQHPQIKNDDKLKWVAGMKGRAFRGMTSAGKKGRGFRHRGHKQQF